MIKANILTKIHDDYIKNRHSIWLLGRPFYFWCTSHHDTFYQVSTQLAFYSGEVQNSFSRWQMWQPSCISDQNDFSFFWSTSHLDDSYQVSFGLLVQEKKWKIDFQDGRHGGNLGFPIRTILAFFDLPVTPMLLPFESIGLLIQEKKQ